ncbi:hypothetical protein GY21_02445 [Cryobacterium roopkundense]|uniref:DUF4190 domain-containing protein n=1 Tax=Cryobacterium roopkundense TaxID=1001240 RepID=A0A099JRN7_9MICO|nr:DUF4190 domain-containing protein [Cryobacterium roopkundense]KGJ80846.1 hypothetical protein GY21_02445 [Cryobacterium roopkundense]MBB5639750.1 hypothetical protein [Cryobacterium roopkundense]
MRLIRYAMRQNDRARGVVPVAGATRTLPLASVVLAVVVPPAGIVLGHVSLDRIARGLVAGRGLAAGALVVGYVVLALELIAVSMAYQANIWG